MSRENRRSENRRWSILNESKSGVDRPGQLRKAWHFQAPALDRQFSANWLRESCSGRKMLLGVSVKLVATLARIGLSGILKRPQIIADRYDWKQNQDKQRKPDKR